MEEATIKDILAACPWLRVVHYLISEANGRHLAHCLDLDVVATDGSQSLAVDKLDDLVKAHIEFALASGQFDNLETKAPNSYWRQFINGEPIKIHSRTIQIRIPEGLAPVPIEASEVGILAHRAA